MGFLRVFVLLLCTSLFAYSFTILAISSPPIFQQHLLKSDELDTWIENEEPIALRGLLANIAPLGQNAKSAVSGSVLASPSQEHPNYFYQWVRDAAITISTLVAHYADDPTSDLGIQLSAIINNYTTLQSQLQHTPNPSGTFNDLTGLGEPKFEPDGSAFQEPWGRPQRDGPALRALTLMAYLRAYNASHSELWGTEDGDAWFGRLYKAVLPAESVIKADLEYVSRFWNSTGFDLWEEVEERHFFTAMVQLRALREGAELARAFGDDGAAVWYSAQAELVARLVKAFWDGGKGYLVQTLGSQRSGLDCGTLLGAVHGDPGIYPPYSEEVLITLLAFVRDQWARFPINIQDSGPFDPAVLKGVGLGRYPEDIYDGYGTSPAGGNPWFLCTATAAEVLFRAVEHLETAQFLTITNLSLPFYSALLASTALIPEPESSYNHTSTLFRSVITRLKDVGDEFLAVIKKHADAEGGLSEQFDKMTGFERGARDLTWSYGEFLQAVRARKRVV